MNKVKAFAITRLGSEAQLIVHFDEGFDTVLEMDFDELKELAALSTACLEQMLDEDRADAQAEADSYQRGLELMESAAEADYQRHGYDDIPF
jgi:arginine utilization protein RocB